MPEMNRWLQIVVMKDSVRAFRYCCIVCLAEPTRFQFKLRLTLIMVIDFAGCWLIELICKHFFADLEPKDMITRGRERRERRRRLQELEKQQAKAIGDGKP
jgi:manganese-transporting P-type ATPase